MPLAWFSGAVLAESGNSRETKIETKNPSEDFINTSERKLILSFQILLSILEKNPPFSYL